MGKQLRDLRGWTGVPAVVVTPRGVHSSAASVGESREGDRVRGVPRSSIVDRRVVVEWGPNESSRL